MVAQSSIGYRSSATANTATGASSVTINKPAGTTTNDVMIANVFVRGSGTTPSVTPPAGWTLIYQDNLDGAVPAGLAAMASYYRVAGASEAANYTWTFDTSRLAVAVISSYTGVNTSTPVDADNGQANAASTTITAPSVTTTVANTMLVGGFGLLEGGQSISPPAGMTERVDISPAGPNLTLEMSNELRAVAGATGQRDATASFSDTSIGQLIALRPASGGNSPPTVSITMPANNASFTAPANITIDANATDSDGTISQVEFFQGTTSLNVDASPSYSYAWSNVGAGSYTLTAKATDNAGATTTSTPVNITVNGSTGGGTGWSDTGAAVVFTDASDKVGIGTTNPATNLHVVGATASQNQHLIVENYAGGARLMLRRANGSLAAPTGIAGGDVLGNIGFSGYSTNGWLLNAGLPTNVATLRGTAAETFTNTAWGTHLSILTTPTGSTTQVERMRVDANGNVGIGTVTPAAKLHVAGANGPNDNTAAPAPDALQVTGGVGGNGTYQASAGGVGGALNLTGGTGGAPVAGFTTAFGGKGGSISLTGGTGGPNVFEAVGGGAGGDVLVNGGVGVANSPGNVILSNLRGNVGIGTGMTSPAFRLDVNGEINATGLRINGSPIATGGSTQWTTAGASIYYTGNVGIGTTTPSTKLHVAGDGTVTGNLTVNGNIAAKYQDVAEWVESSQSLAAGTVVVLDHTKSNQVVASTQAYDTRVAGVISAQPGITLGENGVGKVLVATTGRVKIKVDATRAPIQVGDLLVTGDREGFAIKSLPVSIGGVRLHRPGTLVGKALEPLAKGTGEILVLLSLQ